MARIKYEKKESQTGMFQSGSRKAAAAYSPTWCSSTIGVSRFNFSVRDGKRWNPAAETTAVYVLKEIITVKVRLYGKISGY